MHIRYMGGPGAERMTALLRAKEPLRSAFDYMMNHEETVAARADLQRALADAGISGLTQVTEVEPHPRGWGLVLHIERLDTATATTLAELISAGMREYIATADALDAAFRACGLEGAPVPVARGLRIHLGEISVHTAQALGTLLGAAPALTKLAETPDWPESDQVMMRLDQAMRATSGFVDVQLHPYCARCGHDPSITLGTLSLNTAKHLIATLQNRLKSSSPTTP
ncbi:hypothetical protein [Streptomyces sp. NPDC087212]|uniref:hypothetical protein n=1 Tax=Streptomyces sp. NPDC087212 TaxID=3365766 RepID=UPI0038253BE7